MDPGIDLVLLGRAAGLFDRIDTIDSYGAGVPEPGADDNPLRYKVTWTFAGVLRDREILDAIAYLRTLRR